MRTTCKTCKSRKDQFFSGLINKFPCTLKLCRNNARTFMLLLRKGVSAYEYMDGKLIISVLVLLIVILAKMITIMQKRYEISLK